MRQGIVDACKELKGSIPEEVTASRSGRHSRFPECSECHSRRELWFSAACKPGSDPKEVARLYNLVLEHNREWQADRAVALKLRYSMYNSDTADGIYENDDKCGSQWCRMPVDPSGRIAKNAVEHKYLFGIQANVFCGKEGLIRFGLVPTNVATGGGNFGLTNLMAGLFAAHEQGRLKSKMKKLIRHTDGGGDNVSYVTHIVHWLLVYLGVFDEIIWFRFEPGCGTLCAPLRARWLTFVFPLTGTRILK